MAYLQWQKDYLLLQLITSNYSLMLKNLEIVRNAFEVGDRPAIDTLEAFINWQDIQEKKININQAYLNSKQFLENFIWEAGSIPLVLETDVFPEDLNDRFLEVQVAQILVNKNPFLNKHPEIQLNENKRSLLDLELANNKEERKPIFNVNYNPLIAFDSNNRVGSFLENYKFGFDFSYPLFNRKARGEQQIIQIAMDQNSFDFEIKKQQISIKVQNSLQTEFALSDQGNILNQNIDRNNQLLEAEQIKYNLGESSVFLLNRRLLKLLSANEKWIMVKNKQYENRAKLWFDILKAKV